MFDMSGELSFSRHPSERWRFSVMSLGALGVIFAVLISALLDETKVYYSVAFFMSISFFSLSILSKSNFKIWALLTSLGWLTAFYCLSLNLYGLLRFPEGYIFTVDLISWTIGAIIFLFLVVGLPLSYYVYKLGHDENQNQD